jgi:hypothetical protein
MARQLVYRCAKLLLYYTNILHYNTTTPEAEGVAAGLKVRQTTTLHTTILRYNTATWRGRRLCARRRLKLAQYDSTLLLYYHTTHSVVQYTWCFSPFESGTTPQ